MSKNDPDEQRRQAEAAGRERRRRGAGVFLVIVLAAVALRAVFMQQYAASPFHRRLTMDERFDDAWGLALASGMPTRFDEDPYYREPGYAFFLAGVYGLFGHSRLAVRVLQVLMSAASVALVFYVGRRVYGFVAGVVSALLLAGYDLQILYSDCLTKETLYLLLAASALAAWSVALGDLRARWWLLTGLLCGLTALVRSNGIVIVAIFMVSLFAPSLRRLSSKVSTAGKAAVSADDEATDSARGWASLARAAAALAMGAALIVAPVAIRNSSKRQGFVLTASHLGQNFYFGNGPFADGRSARVPGVRLNPHWERVDMERLAETLAGRDLTSSETSGFWLDKALQHIRHEPAVFLKLLGRKLLLFWNGYESPDPIDLATARRFSGVLRLPLFSFCTIAPLALLGMLLHRCRDRSQWTILAAAVVHVCAVVAFYVTARYRFAALPFLLPLAGAGAAELMRGVTSRDWSRLGLSIAVLIAGTVLCGLPVVTPDLAVGHLILGDYAIEEGSVEEALQHYRRARLAVPGSPDGYVAEGRLLLKLDRSDEARKVLRAGVERCPWASDLQAAYGRLLVSTGQYRQAVNHLRLSVGLQPSSEPIWLDFLSALQLAGDTEGAGEEFRSAVQKLPRSVEIRAQYARYLASHGENDLAREAAIEALELQPDNATARAVLDRLDKARRDQ